MILSLIHPSASVSRSVLTSIHTNEQQVRRGGREEEEEEGSQTKLVTFADWERDCETGGVRDTGIKSQFTGTH